MALRRVVYTSQATDQFNKRELLDLLHESRAFNTIDNITGVLMHHQGHFLQVIEGGSDEIDDLFTRLLRDPRHNEIKILNDTVVHDRLFSNWAMGCADFDEPQLSLIPGVRTDLSNPGVIEEMLVKLPDLAAYLKENLN